jgi:ABC-type transport system involved in multi-copper enzyme maturation permease subunit
VLPLIIGTLSYPAEYRHKTIQITFLGEPKRFIVFIAKVLWAIPLAAIFGATTLIAGFGSLAAVLEITGFDSGITDPETLKAAALTSLITLLWTLLGVCAGSLLTNQVAAIVVVLVVTQFIEPIIMTVVTLTGKLEILTSFLPSGATTSIIATAFPAGATNATTSLTTWWQGALVLLGYSIVLGVLGYVLRQRKDVS